MSLRKRLIGFVLLELVVKTSLLALASTLLVYSFLCLAPPTRSLAIPIRAELGPMLAAPGSLRAEGTTSPPFMAGGLAARSVVEFLGAQIAAGIADSLGTPAVAAAISPSKSLPPRVTLGYSHWLLNVLRGRLGRSLAGQDIGEEVRSRAGFTVLLSFTSLVPALLLSLWLGMFTRRGSLTWASNTAYLLSSLPAFLLGYLLFGLFGASFPVAAITLGLSCGIINEMGRFVGNVMDEEMTRDYIKTARAKGLREGVLPWPGTVRSHAFRNALIPIVPRICILFPMVVSGCMVVEQVFRLQGLSYMLLEGLADKDSARVLIVVLLAVLLVRSVSIIAGGCYVLLNPKSARG